MYVHIGNDDILNRDDIVAILDVKTVLESRNNLKIINKLKERNLDSDQTVIIINKGNKQEYIFSNIAVSTLRKRLNQNLYSYFPDSVEN